MKACAVPPCFFTVVKPLIHRTVLAPKRRSPAPIADLAPIVGSLCIPDRLLLFIIASSVKLFCTLPSIS